nr:hypothetical protein [Planctomycetota bacterium]
MRTKRISVLMVMLIVMTTAASASAVSWTDGGPDHLWSTGSNWSDGNPPSLGEDVFITDGYTGPSIKSTVAAQSGAIRMGGTGTTDILTVSGGSLNSNSHLILGENSGSDARLNISSGSVTVGSLSVGSDGDGVINMRGGAITITDEKLYVSRFGTGQGHVNLNGGTITAPDIYVNGGNINISNSTLIIDGDKRNIIDTYALNGWIIANSGTGPLSVVYNGSNTTVTTQAGEYAWNPDPSNNSIESNADVVLSWTPGQNAISHDVYFGTTNPPPFVQTQPAASYDPPGQLVPDQTYYWRVDEFDGTDIFHGYVWSFTADHDMVYAPVFECDNFILSFNSSTGKVSSFYYKPTGRELLNTGSPGNGFTIYNDGPDERLTNVYKTSDGRLFATNADYSKQVICDMDVSNPRHIAMRIVDFIGIPTSTDAQLKFDFNALYDYIKQTRSNNIPAVYGDGIGHGMLQLDYLTECSSAYTAKFRYIWLREADPDPIGGFALFACEEDETLETLGMIEVAHGLPHPIDYDGNWSKPNNLLGRLSVLEFIFDKNAADRDKCMDYVEQAGLSHMKFSQNAWEGYPEMYTPCRDVFPEGANSFDSMRDFVQMAHDKDVFIGIHTATAHVGWGKTPYYSPTIDSRFAQWGAGTLQSSIGTGDMTILFTPDPGVEFPIDGGSYDDSFMRPPVYPDVFSVDVFSIGNEIILVDSVNTSSVPWILNVAQRGYQSSSPAAHLANDVIKGHLVDRDAGFAIDPYSSLFDEVRDAQIHLANHCQIDQMAYDMINTSDIYGKWGDNKFGWEATLGFDHYCAITGSGTWSTRAHTTVGEPFYLFPTPYFGIFISRAKQAEEDFRYATITAVELRLDEDEHFATPPDEWEWFMNKGCAYDMGVMFLIVLNDIDAHGQKDELLELLKKWEAIRLKYVIDDSHRTAMEQWDTNFHLVSSDYADPTWQITPTKIQHKYGRSNESISLNNPYAAGPLNFELRVLPTFDYSSASNFNLLPADTGDFTIDSGLSVTKIGSEWTFATTNGSATNNSNGLSASHSFASTNLSSKRGVGFYMTGDGKGGAFYVKYLSTAGMTTRNYVVENDFTGTRYIEIPTYTISDDLYSDDFDRRWDYGTYYTGFEFNTIGEEVSFGIIDVPPSTAVSIKIEGV